MSIEILLHSGEHIMTNLVSIDHINLSVDNFSDSAKWYKDIFGFEVVEQGLYQGSPWGVLKAQDTMLCIYEEKNKQTTANDDSLLNQFHRIYHFGLRIKNKKDWELTLSIFNLKIYFQSPIQYPFSTSWYIKDPSGHQIEVSCWENNEVKFNSL